MEAFVYTSLPARIVFEVGGLARLGEEMEGLGVSRALILSTPQQKEMAEKVSAQLGDRAAGIFSHAAMHTPTDVTENAMNAYVAANADCVVAIGGGSTTGLGKAIAYRNDAPQLVIPTTYAGSEVTPILGQTENGLKTTIRGPQILPELVIYDPELTLGLPVGMSVVSGLNALAHALEGLYAKDRNPVISLLAAEGVRALVAALPVIVKSPQDLVARGNALYGAWACGTVLGTVGMSIHHKLCHTLGGSLDLPHAETHAILLPHTIAYVAEAVTGQFAPVREAFGENVGGGLFDFAASLGAPQALKELGVAEGVLDRMTELALANPYWCPRPLEVAPLRQLLQNAWEGRRPE